MMPEALHSYDTLLNAASALPVDQRLRLIGELASTVPEDQAAQISEEWLPILEKRDRDLTSGSVQGDSWEQVRERIFDRAGINREG